MPQEVSEQLKAICREYSYRAVLEAIKKSYDRCPGNDEGEYGTPRSLSFQFYQDIFTEDGWVSCNEDEMPSLYQSQVKNSDSF